MEEIKSCASRKRGDEHKIETRKDELANCVTSIDTDSMVREPRVINPLKGKTDKSWFFEQQVYDVNGIARAVKSTEGSGNEPKILTPLRTEEGRQLRKQGIEKFSNRALYPREDGVSNTITSVQKDNLLQEPNDTTICLNSKVNGKQPSVYDRVYSEDGCAVAITSGWLQNVCTEDKNGTEYKGKFIKEGDGLYTNVSKDFIRGGLEGVSRTLKAEKHDAATCIKEGARYRIRKLTEREVFRLMDVSEEDIDKIQAAGISKTAQYKLAGNSIVVSCLYHIFRKMFIELGCEEQQLSLF